MVFFNTLFRSPEGNIARIRWFRNEIVHNRARGIDTLTFETFWSSIAIAVVSLGIRKEEVQELRQRPLDEKLYLNLLLEWKTQEQNMKAVKRSVSQNEEELKELSKAVRALEETFRRNSREMNASEPEALLQNLAKIDFTGDINFYSSRYHPDTRQWIFEAFELWFNNKDSDSKVFLVTGNPGMGKSVIAGVICKQLQRAHCLGGAFFCQHGNLRCRSARFLIQSIAHGLCEVLPEYKGCLLKNLCHNMGQAIERMSTEELFAEFLQGPLNKISAPVQYLVVVIDGLDECEYESKNEILRLISLKFPRLPQWLKFFVTSRPEVNVMERLQILKPFVLKQDDAENIKDIKSFVRSNLSPLICSGDLERSVDAVTQQAQGLMLLAYFLVTYVKHTGKREMTFDDIRQIYPRGISSVYEDYLYHFLKDLVGFPSRRVRAFLSTVTAARAPLPVAILGKVLVGEDEEPQNRRKSLGKLIDSVSVLLPVVNDHIHVFHKSFIDWLSEAELHWDPDISVDIKEGHRILADICRDAFEDVKRKPSFDESSPLITYSLLYGVQHIVQVSDTKETRDELFNCVTDLELIHAKLLCPCCPYYSVLEDILLALDVLASEHDPDITSSINDCLHVLKRHASILCKDPSLIYQFLFNKAETEKIVRSAKMCLENNCKNTPWIRIRNKTAYQGPIRASNNCSSAITAADVSPNNDMVVFGCSNGALVLWSLRTARQMWIRNSEKQTATCCLFAPDGSYIVFGFLSNVYLLSGECLPLFPKVTMEFEDCIFKAPENKAILTRDRHGAIDIWDSTNGNRLGHRLLRFGACCCKFSVCGRFIVAVTTQELYLLCSKTCTIIKRSQLAGSPLVQPILMCVSLCGGSTGVLMCQNQEVVHAFSINDKEIKCLDLLPKDLRILGTARDGSFILLDDATQAEDFHLPFSVMYVPHVGGSTGNLTAIDVNPSSCLAWEGSTFFLFNISTSSEKCLIQDKVKRLMFMPPTSGASRLFSSSNMGITTTDLQNQQREYRSVDECGSFCVSQSRKWFIISQRNRMRKTSLSSGQDLELFELDIERNIWDIRFLTEELILIVARLVIDWFDTLLLVFDAQKWQVRTSTAGHAMKIFSIDVFSSGTNVVTSDDDGNLVVWDATTFKACTKAVIDFEEGLSVCKCAPDGELVGSFTVGGNRIYLFESYTLQLIQILVFPTQSPVLGCRLASSSDYLISLTQDRVLRIWATKTGKTVSMLEFDRLPGLLAICPQTDVIAVSLENGKILLGSVLFPGFVSIL